MAARALRLDPVSVVVATQLGTMLAFAREHDDAARAFAAALELDPHFDMAHTYLAELYLDAGEYDLALAQLERVESTSGEFAPLPHRARALARMGDRKTARALLGQLTRPDHRYTPPALVAAIHAELGEMGAAFAWLERAVTEQDSHIPLLGVWPRFDTLRRDGRFGGLLRRLGIEG